MRQHSQGKAAQPRKLGHRCNRRSLLWLSVFGAIALAVLATGMLQEDVLNLGGLPLLGRFLQGSLHPDLRLSFLALTLKATGVTFAFAVGGTALSLGFGFMGGILAAEVWWVTLFPHRPWTRSLVGTMRALLSIPRAIHELIWGLFFVHLLGLDPLVGIVAIAIPYGATVAKVFAEILDDTPRAPLNALTHSGVHPLLALFYGLMPQALLNLVSYSCYRFECALRSAAVLGIIGAGGLGYEIFLSLQSLRYEQLWTLFYALIGLNGLVDWGSAWIRRHINAPTRLDLNARKGAALRPRSWEPANALANAASSSASSSLSSSPANSLSPPPLNHLLLGGVGVGVILVPLAFVMVGVDLGQGVAEGLLSGEIWTRLGAMGQQAFPPQVTWAEGKMLGVRSLQTVVMSVVAIAIASLGGMLLAFLAAHTLFIPGGLLLPAASPEQDKYQIPLAWIWVGITRIVLLVCRGIPAPIWALVCLFVLFPGILPGAIALGIHNLGILGRLMAEGIENLDPRPLRALKAQGINAPLVLLYGVLPLCLPRFAAYSFYRWEVCLRETVIVGLVGAGGLGRVLTEQLSSFDYAGVVVTLGCFIGLTLGADYLSGILRRSLQ